MEEPETETIVRNKTRAAWITEKEYFGRFLRRHQGLVVILVLFSLSSYFWGPMLTSEPEDEPPEGFFPWGMLAISFFVVGVHTYRAFYLRTIPRRFIRWGSCQSRYASQPLWDMSRHLKLKNIRNRPLTTFSQLRALKGKPRYSFTNIIALELPGRELFIEFWASGGRVDGRIQRYYLVCLSGEGMRDDSEKTRELKKLIEDRLSQLPDGNPFCAICSNTPGSVCYSGEYPHSRGDLIFRSIHKINPYENDVIFKELLEKKKLFEGEKYPVGHLIAEFKKYIESWRSEPEK